MYNLCLIILVVILFIWLIYRVFQKEGMLEMVEDSNIYYYKKVGYLPAVDLYYTYIRSIIKDVIFNNNLKVNIVFGNHDYVIRNENKTIKISVNDDHSIAKKGGISLRGNEPMGKTRYGPKPDDRYLVYIQKPEVFNKSDIVVDHSITNIYHITESGHHNDLSQKLVYVAPAVFNNFHFNKNNRSIPVLTTVQSVFGRRKILLDNLKNESIGHRNVNGLFTEKDQTDLFKKTKILINLHQWAEFHTFEEQRVVPVLQCGVLVVAESSPLAELLTYRDMIIWADYDDLITRTKEVIKNYDKYHSLIFTDRNIQKLKQLKKLNYNNLEEILIRKYNEKVL